MQFQMLQRYDTMENLLLQREETKQRKEELEDKKDLLYDTIMRYMQYFTEAEDLTEDTMQKLEEEVRLRKQRMDDKNAALEQSLRELRLQKEKITWELESMQDNERMLSIAKQKLEALEQARSEKRKEIEAIQLALSTIQEAAVQIHDSFGQALNYRVSDRMGKITANKYTDVKLDERLQIKLGMDHNYVELDRLSTGTIDQVYFALRLAIADWLLKEEEMPILLDESFAFYDENRVKNVLMMLASQKQVILFSCHKREMNLLQELGLPYHLVELT